MGSPEEVMLSQVFAERVNPKGAGGHVLLVRARI